MYDQSVRVRLQKIRSKQPWMVLSAAEKFFLASSNNPAISHFYSFEAGDNVEESFAIPDGCVDMLFDCDQSQPHAEVFGTPMAAIDIPLERHHRYFGVRFASGTVPDCLGVSAQELIEHHYSLQDVIPHANQLFDAIVGQTNFVDQVSSFQTFFAGKGARQLTALTQDMVNRIFALQGNVRIDELAEQTGYTTRTLQRQFKSDMGMSPKQFARIVRCQSAVYKINHSDQVVLADIVYDLGFSDQPHFLREFKKLVHATPVSYQNRVKQQTYIERIHHF